MTFQPRDTGRTGKALTPKASPPSAADELRQLVQSATTVAQLKTAMLRLLDAR